MCTFKITNDPNEIFVDQYLQLGGPTLSNTIELNGVYITHHLLSITGEVTMQPVERGGKYFLLMGEFYNYDISLPSDIYFGIEKYLEYGDKFTEHLDGEFLFIVIDNNKIDFFSDPWGTRQVYYHTVGDYFYFTTLPNDEYSLYTTGYSDEFYRLPCNKKCDFNGTLHVGSADLIKWNLDQNVNSLEYVDCAFEDAVLKRWYPNCTLFLSGGLDSSAIALCFADNKKKFNALTNMFHPQFEDQDVLDSVIEYCGEYINYHCIEGTNINHKPKHSATSEIRRQTKERFDSKVVIMGNGADEIFDNYRNKGKSNFDIFPHDQSTIFPWEHFYGGQSRKLLDYHETYSLFYGLEQRNVFYDKSLAQAWLNVDVNIKNIEYKVFMKEYLRKRDIKIPKFPKSGFGNQSPSGYTK
jgi:asparagine synthetase B (glutamine-hydrolysing)|tara:strand:- start:2356 stop:3585 length:1230 start_codon:yes stop_codon:yes gene_type:complete